MDPERAVQFILDSLARLSARSEEHAARLAEHDASIQKLTDLIGRLAQAELVLNERMLATDERLNALIKVVDDLVRRNGHSH